MPTTQPIPFYIPILIVAVLAALVAAYFLYLRKPQLAQQQELNVRIVMFICLALALFAAGMWLGDNMNPSLVVRPASEAMQPFWQLQAFDFESDAEGWQADPACGKVDLVVENNADKAYSGAGYLRLDADLQGPGEGDAITLEQMACLKYEPASPSWQLGMADGIVGYVKVESSLDALGNVFQAEYQVRGTSGQDVHWAKARYPLKVGEWTPMVWVKPSWLQMGDQQLFFPPTADGVWVTIWASKGFKGDILIDNIAFYMLQRK